MPFTRFQFRDQNGRSVDLFEIDKEMCYAYDRKPDEQYFCPMLQIFLQVAVTLLCDNGSGVMTETLLEDFLKQNPETEPQHREVLKSFFIRKYVFTSWPTDE